MATADLSIFQGLLQPPKSVADYDMQAAQLQGVKQQNQTQGLNYQIAQRNLDRSNQLLSLSRNMPQGATDLDRLTALRNAGFYDEADKLDTSMQNRVKTTAEAGKANADAAATTAESAIKKRTAFLSGVSQFQSPDDVKQFLANGVQTGNIQMDQATQMIAKVPTDPAAFKQWQTATLQALMSPKDQTALTMPSADAKLSAATSTANTGTTAAAHIQAANIGAGASMANNRATIAKDYAINGIDPQTGNFIGMGTAAPGGAPAAPGTAAPVSPMAGMVDALGTYKMDPSQAFARMAPGMKAGVIAAVQQKYPEYDPTTYTSKRAAATAFTTGKEGNALRSFAVGLDHLDQLGQLTDALNNGNYPLVNKLGNVVAQQTGNPAPTNFDAAKIVVSKEVIKAIVGGGGGVSEREEVAHILDAAKSPAQLKGAIQTITGLMRAQHDALLTQRRAAGLPDSTAPDYSHGGGGAGSDPLGLRK